MLKRDAKITIVHIPIAQLHVHENKARYLSMVATYVEQMHLYPHDDAGMIRVEPCKEHPGLYTIIDGHHRYCASIIAGRGDMRCIVIED